MVVLLRALSSSRACNSRACCNPSRDSLMRLIASLSGCVLKFSKVTRISCDKGWSARQTRSEMCRMFYLCWIFVEQHLSWQCKFDHTQRFWSGFRLSSGNSNQQRNAKEDFQYVAVKMSDGECSVWEKSKQRVRVGVLVLPGVRLVSPPEVTAKPYSFQAAATT